MIILASTLRCRLQINKKLFSMQHYRISRLIMQICFKLHYHQQLNAAYTNKLLNLRVIMSSKTLLNRLQLSAKATKITGHKFLYPIS